MNKIFKTVFNSNTNSWVAVPEFSKAHKTANSYTQTSIFSPKLKLLSIIIANSLFINGAWASACEWVMLNNEEHIDCGFGNNTPEKSLDNMTSLVSFKVKNLTTIGYFNNSYSGNDGNLRAINNKLEDTTIIGISNVASAANSAVIGYDNHAHIHTPTDGNPVSNVYIFGSENNRILNSDNEKIEAGAALIAHSSNKESNYQVPLRNDTLVLGFRNNNIPQSSDITFGNNVTVIGSDNIGNAANSITIGYGANKQSATGNGENSIAIGYNATASKKDSIAIGSNSSATVDAGVMGTFFTANGKTVPTVSDGIKKSKYAAVNFGGRQLTGVSAGKKDDDAVNVAQLNDLKASMGNGGNGGGSGGMSSFQISAGANTATINSSTNKITFSGDSYITPTVTDTGTVSLGFNTTTLDSAITGKGYQTATQVEGIVTGKGYQTSTDVEKTITGKGFATEQWVNEQKFLKNGTGDNAVATQGWVNEQKFLKNGTGDNAFATQGWVTGKNYLTSADKENLEKQIKDVSNNPNGMSSFQISAGAKTATINSSTNKITFSGDSYITPTVTDTGTVSLGFNTTTLDSAISGKGFQTQSQVNEAIGNATKDLAKTSDLTGFAKTSDLDNFQTAEQVTSAIKTATQNFQTADQVNATINGKGFVTADEVNSTITGKGYQTATQVEGIVKGQGYQTQADVQNLINAGKFLTEDQVKTVIDDKGLATQTWVSGEIAKAKIDGSTVDTSQFVTKGMLDDYTTATDVNNIIDGKKFQTAEQVETAVKAMGYQTSTDVENAITGKGYQTEAQVKSIVSGQGFQTADDVNTIVNKKGFQTADDVNTLVSSKGFQTKTQVESIVLGQGFQTSEQVSSAIKTATADFATQGWVEGKNYLTSSDLGSYATQDWVNGEIQKAKIDGSTVDTSQFVTKGMLADYTTTADMNDAIKAEAASYISGQGFQTATQVGDAIKNATKDFQTAEQVNATIATKGFQTAEQVNDLISLKNYQTAEQVNSAIDAKGFVTKDQVNSTIDARGFQTQEQVNSLIATKNFQTADQVNATINSKGFATQTWVGEQGFQTKAQITESIDAKDSLNKDWTRGLVADEIAKAKLDPTSGIDPSTFVTKTDLAEYTKTTDMNTAIDSRANKAAQEFISGKNFQTAAQVEETLTNKGYLDTTRVNALIDTKGFQTENQVNTLISGKGFQNENQVNALIDARGYQTQTQVKEAIDAAKLSASGVDLSAYAKTDDVEKTINSKGFQTATDVDNAITAKGYQTATDVEGMVTAKGYQTATDVEKVITGKGFATENWVNTQGFLKNGTGSNAFATQGWVEQQVSNANFANNVNKQNFNTTLDTYIQSESNNSYSNLADVIKRIDNNFNTVGTTKPAPFKPTPNPKAKLLSANLSNSTKSKVLSSTLGANPQSKVLSDPLTGNEAGMFFGVNENQGTYAWGIVFREGTGITREDIGQDIVLDIDYSKSGVSKYLAGELGKGDSALTQALAKELGNEESTLGKILANSGNATFDPTQINEDVKKLQDSVKNLQDLDLEKLSQDAANSLAKSDALSDTVKNLSGKVDKKVTTFKVAGDSGEAFDVGNNGTININGDGKNISTVASKGNSGAVTIKLADDINVNSVTADTVTANTVSANSISVGSTRINNNAISVGSTSISDGAISVGNGVSLTSSGLHNGDNRITGVAPGVAPTDAVNVEQLQSLANSVSEYVAGSEARLSQYINKVEKNSNAAAAAAMASAGLQTAALPGGNSMSVSAVTYAGEQGYALGYMKMSQSGKWGFRAFGNANSRGKYGVGASVGFHWQ